MSNQSEQINELAMALSKAQGEIVGAKKDSQNPFFKSNYADLASVWDAIREPLSKNGLAVVQTMEAAVGEETLLHTTLVHSSGQWIRGYAAIKAKDASPQAQGSAITYARRYALAAIVGVAQIDDDANAAQGRTAPVQRSTTYPQSVDTSRTVTSAAGIDFKEPAQAPKANPFQKSLDKIGQNLTPSNIPRPKV